MAVFNHIIVPLDGSRLAECVLPHLLALSDEDTRVSLLRVLEMEPEQPVDPLDWRFNHSEAEAYLERIADLLRDATLANIDYAVLEGPAADQVIAYGQKTDGDLILMSSHGKSGINRWNVSDAVRKIVQRAQRSTMIVRAYNFDSITLAPVQYKTILVALDGSFRAETTLPQAVALAQKHGARMILAHVIIRPELIQRVPHTPEDQELLDRLLTRTTEISEKYMQQMRSRIPGEFDCDIRVSTDVTSTLQKIADEHEADLIFLSAHGHSADPARFYGNVAGGLIEYGTTPLVTIQDFSPEDLQPTRAEEAAREQKGHA